MFYEFAIQPECMVDINHFSLLRKEFSASSGRFVARFPEQWPKMVRDATSGLTFIQKKRIKSELERLRKEGMITTSRKYNGDADWLKNVSMQYSEKPPHPFYAVVTKQQLEGVSPCILLNENIDIKDYDEWDIPADRRIPRVANDLVRAVCPLLKISKRVLFVDKMFEPASFRWQEVLVALVEQSISSKGELPTLEYHVKIDRDDEFRDPEERNQEYQKYCDRNLSPILPSGVPLNIYWWAQKDRGDFFHGRYVLTDRGGVRFDWGLDKGKPGESTDVSRMSIATKDEYLNMFNVDSDILDLIEHVVVTGAKD